jgi:hypothetical protein
VDLEPLVELLAAACKGIVNLWRRWRRRPANEMTTLRLDAPQGANLTIIVIAPGSKPHVAVVAAPKNGSEDQAETR